MTYRPWLPIKVIKSGKIPRNDGEITESQLRCLRLLNEGKAGVDEQQIALQAIFWICGTDDLEYLPDEHGGVRDSAFKSGKRAVGLSIRKLVNLPLKLLIGENDG